MKHFELITDEHGTRINQTQETFIKAIKDGFGSVKR